MVLGVSGQTFQVLLVPVGTGNIYGALYAKDYLCTFAANSVGRVMILYKLSTMTPSSRFFLPFPE